MTDQELIEQFESGSLPDQCFHHREHVRTAFLYLTSYPILEALDRFSKALRRFAELRGKPQLYHQTITWAYVFLIRERMARAGSSHGWEEFARDNPDLLVWKDGILTRFYRSETLTSDLARAVFLLPDLRDLDGPAVKIEQKQGGSFDMFRHRSRESQALIAKDFKRLPTEF